MGGEKPGRNQRGEDGGGSLSGREHREVGSVWGEAQGLLAWVLVEALFSTGMINTQVSALYFAGKLYLCFQYFSEITCISSVQFSSVAQSCPTLCNPIDCSEPGLPVHHQLPEFTQTHIHWGFPGGSDCKASARNVGDQGLIPGSGRSPGEGNGNPLQYSCLENSMDGGAWWATVHGVAKSQT